VLRIVNLSHSAATRQPRKAHDEALEVAKAGLTGENGAEEIKKIRYTFHGRTPLKFVVIFQAYVLSIIWSIFPKLQVTITLLFSNNDDKHQRFKVIDIKIFFGLFRFHKFAVLLFAGRRYRVGMPD